ncbi:VOC family protein [Staphylococcus simulans]|uniref:VOC family protein n=1 Tax=Staphylococcus simulans TaxID=1286 RepID=UPI0021D00872|nr:VOC family protein [Staphylococcus simulans]UXR35511.1 VOC family protein [Staphylococcus simulans]
MTLITGHHHISMYTKDARENKQFYTEVLGLRLIEKSVNQDNPSMYHLFYGDETGAPGTLLTFFEMKMLGKHHSGTNSIERLVLLVPDEAALDYFKERLNKNQVETEAITYLRQQALAFEDPDGLKLILMVNGDNAVPNAWHANPYTDVPQEFQILGMGPVELHLRNLQPTIDFLTNTLGYHAHFGDDNVYTLNPNGRYTDFVLVEEQGQSVKPGRGYVHHIAVSVPTDEALETLLDKLEQLPGSTSGIIDRYFFKSIYYRNNKILYEFATEAPGFTVDTDVKDLGSKLALPDFLEHKREQIENQLEEI